jgi:hypothetical protein
MTAMAQATAEPTAMVLRHPNNELARTGDDDFMPVVSLQQMIQRRNAMVDLVKSDVMKLGIDYGVIPGTERKNQDGTPSNRNNTLLKPGAEKLCTLFGLVPTFEDYRVVEDWDKGIFYYAYRCKLYRRGHVVGEGIGSANSREKKYRRGARACPECGAPTIKKSKYPPKDAPGTAPGWYCHAKDGGCGRSFEAEDERILNQAMTVDPAEAADQINTLQKMAQKRALVASTLIATNASEFFTQDAEDMQFIDAESSDGKQPAPKGRHMVDPETGEVIDERQQKPQQQKPQGPDLSNDDVFKAEWTKAATARGFTPAGAVALLDSKLASKNLKLPALSLKNRQALGQKMLAGDYDCLRDEFNKLGAAEAPKGDTATKPPEPKATPSAEAPKPQTPADVGVDPDELKDWDEFKRQYKGAAAGHGADDAKAEKALGMALMHVQKRGKEQSTTIHWRVEVLTAVLADAFDYETGKLNRAKLALDAPAVAGAR